MDCLCKHWEQIRGIYEYAFKISKQNSAMIFEAKKMNQKKGKGRPNYVCYTSCLGAVIAMTEMLKAAAHEYIRIGKGNKI